VLVSGATMGLRGGAAFACASPIKFALRSYCQSMSQAYHKEGVHIGHVVIDGVIDSPATHAWGGSVMLMDPAHLAHGAGVSRPARAEADRVVARDSAHAAERLHWHAPVVVY
jgi:hypothetical protein